MSDHSSSGNGNSWTILTPEEPGVENVGPLPEGQGESASSEPAQVQTEQLEPDLSQGSELKDGQTEQPHVSEPPQVTPLENSEDAALLHGTHIKEELTPSGVTPVENLTSLTTQQGASSDRSESEPLLNPDADTFSDSYTHISPSSVSAQREAERLSHDDEESKPSFEESEENRNEGDGLRRRNIPFQTPLSHRDDDEEEEGEEEPFRPPQREDGVGLSLNKCIFGAVILLTLGTIFFSGALMDLDDEGEADMNELKDAELSKEWLNPEAPRDTSADVKSAEILEKLTRESQHVAALQAQLEEQEGALKAAQLQVEEGSKERMRREELEVENQKMRGELDQLPVLQKELEQESERVKRESERAIKDLEALPGMQKELELLKAKVTELSQNTGTDRTQAPPTDSAPVTPSAGHDGELPAIQGGKEMKHKKQDDKKKDKEQRKEEKERKEWKKDKSDKLEEGKPWKERKDERKGQKGEKHWEKEKSFQEDNKEQRGRGERKEWKDGKDEKDGKRGAKRDEGKQWKDGEENREFKEGSGKREWKEDKKWKKEKHWELDGGKRDTKEHKDSGDKTTDGKSWKHGGEQKERKKEKEWKKDKQGGWKEENEWKERGEKKRERGEEEDQASPKGDRKHGEKPRQEKKWKGEKDDHKKNDGKKEWKQREDKHKRGKEREEWAEEEERKESRKEERKQKDSHHKKEKREKDLKETSHHLYSEQKHNEEHMHGDYWSRQRDRIRHYHGSIGKCSSMAACAHAEGLSPVAQPAFEGLLFHYLSRLDGTDEQASKKNQLKKLVGEFFSDGVFVHDQIPFGEFAEDVEDILEDMAEEGADDDEEEMEGFAREAMEKFVLPNRGGSEGSRRESGRNRASG